MAAGVGAGQGGGEVVEEAAEAGAVKVVRSVGVPVGGDPLRGGASRSRRSGSRAAWPASVTTQPAGPAVGLVGHPAHQALLDEDGDVPADRRRVGVHAVRRARPAGAGRAGRAGRAARGRRGRGVVGDVCVLSACTRRMKRGSCSESVSHGAVAGARRLRPRPGAGGHDGSSAASGTVARYNSLHDTRNQLHDCIQCDPGDVARRSAPAVGSWGAGADRRYPDAREEREHAGEFPAGRPPGAARRRSRSPTSTGCAGGSTGCAATRDPQARERQRERIAADVAAAEERIARRRAAVPVISYPDELPVSAAAGRHRRGAARRPGRRRRRRDRLGQDDAAAQDRPGAGPRACAAGSGTPSRAGSPPAASPSGSPRSSTAPLGEVVGYKMRFNDQVVGRARWSSS